MAGERDEDVVEGRPAQRDVVDPDPGGVELPHRLGGALVPFGIFVVGLSLVLLTIVFRSIWVPVKAALGYLLLSRTSSPAIVKASRSTRKGEGALVGSAAEALGAIRVVQSYGLEEPALATLARECYRLLGLQSYFTAGEKEIRAWTVKKGATGPPAAGVIHTDFEKGYIRAQVYSLADLEAHHSEAGIKAAGKLRMEGKEYVVQDGDIMHFLFNV